MKENYSQKFLDIRKALSLTQSEMAEKLGIPRVRVSQIETGYQKPTLDLIQAVINKFNISANYIFNKSTMIYSSYSDDIANISEPKPEYKVQMKDGSIAEILKKLATDERIKSLEDKIRMLERIIESKDQTINTLLSK